MRLNPPIKYTKPNPAIKMVFLTFLRGWITSQLDPFKFKVASLYDHFYFHSIIIAHKTLKYKNIFLFLHYFSFLCKLTKQVKEK